MNPNMKVRVVITMPGLLPESDARETHRAIKTVVLNAARHTICLVGARERDIEIHIESTNAGMEAVVRITAPVYLSINTFARQAQVSLESLARDIPSVPQAVAVSIHTSRGEESTQEQRKGPGWVFFILLITVFGLLAIVASYIL